MSPLFGLFTYHSRVAGGPEWGRGDRLVVSGVTGSSPADPEAGDPTDSRDTNSSFPGYDTYTGDQFCQSRGQ